MREKHKLQLCYRGSASTEATERMVCPYACVFASGAWYLVANCEKVAGLRVFRLDRIESLSESDEKFELPEGFSLDDVVREGRVFLGQANEEVKIRYSPAVARWVAERAGKDLDGDGSITLSYPLADTRWVVRHVLQYGPEAQVLEPDTARTAVVEALQQIVNVTG